MKCQSISSILLVVMVKFVLMLVELKWILTLKHNNILMKIKC